MTVYLKYSEVLNVGIFMNKILVEQFITLTS